MTYVEPLEPRAWFAALRKLSLRIDVCPSDAHEQLLRHAYHLLQLVPAPLRGTVHVELNEAQYELRLECGAYDSAALELVGHSMIYSVEKHSADVFSAEARLRDHPEASSATATTLPLAILAAWLQCLIALEVRSSV